MSHSDAPDEAKRPIPAREGLGAAGGASGAAEEGEREGKESPGGSEAPRPTPVREMMSPEPGVTGDWEVPRRTFEHDGKEWIVTLAGRTVTGFPPDPGAPLMKLHFAPAEAPESPEWELLCVGRGLDALYDEELRHYLERARPYREDSR